MVAKLNLHLAQFECERTAAENSQTKSPRTTRPQRSLCPFQFVLQGSRRIWPETNFLAAFGLKPAESVILGLRGSLLTIVLETHIGTIPITTLRCHMGSRQLQTFTQLIGKRKHSGSRSSGQVHIAVVDFKCLDLKGRIFRKYSLLF